MWRTLVAAAVIGTACLPGDSATSQKISGQSASPPGSVQSRSPNVVGGADREPIELPRYSEGTAVIDAIVAAGFDIDKIADSYQKPFRVDALFLDPPPGHVRVCRFPVSRSGIDPL